MMGLDKINFYLKGEFHKCVWNSSQKFLSGLKEQIDSPVWLWPLGSTEGL